MTTSSCHALPKLTCSIKRGSSEQDQAWFLAGGRLQEGFLVVAYDPNLDGTGLWGGFLRLQMAEMIGTAFQVKGTVCAALAVESRRGLGRNRTRARLEGGVTVEGDWQPTLHSLMLKSELWSQTAWTWILALS